MKKNQYLYLKEGVNIDDILYMNPALFSMLSYALNFCHIHKLPCKITSIYRTPAEDKALGAKSKTHQQYRAFDMSLHEWPEIAVMRFRRNIEKDFDKVGAISSKTLKSRPIYVHDNGNGYHAHLQIRPNL